ncbi:MAG: peptidase MA family metallohydrolase [Spirochaetota bacterium]|nr:peptidase MA family metallohydrolase [Spirochaetota bacterium]
MRATLILLSFLTANLSISQSQQYHSKNFIAYHSNDIEHYWINKCISTLENIYESLGEIFNYFPKKPISVIIYSKTWQFTQATKLPYHIGAIFDGTLKIQHPKILHKKKILKSILTHEYTHIIINEITKRKIPLWFNEGLASYIANQNYFFKFQTKIKSFNELNQLLTNKKSKQQLQYAYSISLKIIKHLINKYSFSKILKLLHHVNTTNSFNKSFKIIYNFKLIDLENHFFHTKN